MLRRRSASGRSGPWPGAGAAEVRRTRARARAPGPWRRSPSAAGVAREEDGAVRRAEGDGATARGETAGVHVVGEPLRQSATAALEARAAHERTTIEGGAATAMAGGRAEEHHVP